MKASTHLSIFLLFSLLSCRSINRLLAPAATPKEAYERVLVQEKRNETVAGKAWLDASKRALDKPLAISLPYRQRGYFAPEAPTAMALVFSATAGAQLHFTLTQMAAGSSLFAEIYQLGQDGKPVLVKALDTMDKEWRIPIAATADYLLSLQAPLALAAGYHLSIGIEPSLGFPVDHPRAAIGSEWGDARDGGKRSHEGIDIFAPKGSPALAAANGRITAVREGGLGGKTIWLQPEGASYSLYYAHLDRQLVEEGQMVSKGTVIGTVGNTGNAQNTPSHLHFGVYTLQGAINPLPFVKKQNRTAAAIPDKHFPLRLQLARPQSIPALSASAVWPALALNKDGYIVQTPAGDCLVVDPQSVKFL